MRAAALAPSRSAAALAAPAPRRASAVAPLAAKPTKAADFCGLSNEEIDTAVAESKRALFDMRIAQKTRQVGLIVMSSAALWARGRRRKRVSRHSEGRHPAPSTFRRLVATKLRRPSISCVPLSSRFDPGLYFVLHCVGVFDVNARVSSR